MNTLLSMISSARTSGIYSTSLFIVVGALVVLLGWGAVTTPAHAQDEDQNGETPQPQRYEDVTWNWAVLVDYKSGKMGRALEIISNHFIPAYRAADVPVPHAIELQTGP